VSLVKENGTGTTEGKTVATAGGAKISDFLQWITARITTL